MPGRQITMVICGSAQGLHGLYDRQVLRTFFLAGTAADAVGGVVAFGDPLSIFHLRRRVVAVGVPLVEILDEVRNVELLRTWQAVLAAGAGILYQLVVFGRNFIDDSQLFS